MFSKVITLVILICLSIIIFVVSTSADIGQEQKPTGIDPPHLYLGGTNSCTFCHADYNNKPEPLTEDWISFTVCKSCHANSGSATPAEVHIVPGDTIWCETCHNPHHHQDIWPHKYINTLIQKPDGTAKDVVFADSLDFVHGDPEYDGICEVCHTLTNYHRNNSSGDHTHNLGTDCMECHSHTGGFQSSCTSCHGAQGVNSAPPVDIFGSSDSYEVGKHQQHLQISIDSTGSACDLCHFERGPGTGFHGNGGGQAYVNFHSSAGASATWTDGIRGVSAGSCSDIVCHSDVDWDPSAHSDCSLCHTIHQDNGDGIPADGRRAVIGEFNNTSHHVQTEVQAEDCLVCHDQSQHMQGYIRLKDPDQVGTIYIYDTATPEEKEIFCINCHDADGVSTGAGTKPFSDSLTVPNVKGVTGSLWSGSAHKSANQFCGDCHVDNGHGSDNIKLMNTPTVDGLCYNCHTEGMVLNTALSGDTLANDIQQAFGLAEKHNLGTTFSVNSNTYTLQCTTCHNPHVVTGKHWEVDSGFSPVTRPDLSADPVLNPRAMGNSLWGAIPGQKMDDFAASGTGTGGWYYSIARGSNIIWDQPAVYQPPKTNTGYNFEFGGEVLPDYTTLCLDCHTNRMSDANPPVNWGQGIPCTDNSVDPPNQRIECGAQHGLLAAGKPSYISDEGTPGFWGTSGNPDVIFHMNYVTRGRGVGHFMRWPYDSAERTAGINFVMSCTDCHEAHGSNAASMLRFTINAYGPGTDNWNTMCNNCHYYYGGQHAGMSCGNASCHEANSIHRIIHTTNSGAGTALQLTASGYESNYQRPDFTPEIDYVRGFIDSNRVDVVFTQGVFTNDDLTGTLESSDFWLFDINDDNPRSITGISHTAGDTVATLTLSSPLIESDVNDLLATTGKSIWCWYTGGYVNPGTNDTIQAQAVSAGPWPVGFSVCPDSAVFQLNESAGSASVTDERGLLIGTVNNPSVAMPGDGYFHGDENDSTYIEFGNSAPCLISSRAVTVEALVKTSTVDLDFGDTTRNSTQQRIIERKRTFQVTIMRGDWMNDSIASRAGKARIMFKYRVTPPYRRDCGEEGLGAWMKQVFSDIDAYPIVDNHWYKIRVVFNSDKPHIPVDIWADDQGTDGSGAGELWAGYINIALPDPENSGGCRWMSQPGDEMATENQMTFIGDNPNHNDIPGTQNNQLFKGLIDWVIWKPVADYSNVDGPPN
jgi:predicted CXXCH cytochrome family protein